MDVWDNDFLDLIEEAHLTFKGAADGEIAFGALKGFLDVRYGARDGSACAEFSWEGHDENDPACGRRWVPSAPPAASSATSISITPTIQASSSSHLTGTTELTARVALTRMLPELAEPLWTH